MRRSRLRFVLPITSAVTGLAAVTHARPAIADMAVAPRPRFSMLGTPIGGSKPAHAAPAYLTATRIAALPDGTLVIDEDSGDLIRADAQGKAIEKLAIGRQAGLLTYDRQSKRAFVADRNGNRLVVVDVGDALSVVRSIATPVEPYGVALTPDRATVLVSTIADRTLLAYETATGKELWRAALTSEPRGIAVSPDGSRVLVASLATGSVDTIALEGTHARERIALSVPSRSSNEFDCTKCVANPAPQQVQVNAAVMTPLPAFARAAFAVTFMGDHQAVVPFQRETPVQIAGEGRSGGYGGGFEAPVVHQLAFLGLGGKPAQTEATITQHQPHALVWDGAHDALYVAGLGNDSVLQIRKASQSSLGEGVTVSLREDASASGPAGRCGPDGLAMADNGDLLVWCSFTRSIDRIAVTDAKGALAPNGTTTRGPELVASAFSATQHTGLVLFHESDFTVSAAGALACASCHPDGRADGLTWKIDKSQLQTPVLAGRVVGTHPFKWDGGDKDLPTSLATTMKRLGGSGLDANATANLTAYLEALPRPAVPTRDPSAVARGKQLFETQLGCAGCHDGATYTDRELHKFAGSTLAQAKTPSLIGLAASGPYYHDGSAPTLEALLHGRGNVRGMADTSKLDDHQVADLSAFLDTL
jgi:DNA-binding beta-propeller fold protein YncE